MSFSIFVIDAKLDTKALNDEKIKERKLTIAKKMIQDVAKDYMIAKQTLEDLTKVHDPTKDQNPPRNNQALRTSSESARTSST